MPKSAESYASEAVRVFCSIKRNRDALTFAQIELLEACIAAQVGAAQLEAREEGVEIVKRRAAVRSLSRMPKEQG